MRYNIEIRIGAHEEAFEKDHGIARATQDAWYRVVMDAHPKTSIRLLSYDVFKNEDLPPGSRTSVRFKFDVE